MNNTIKIIIEKHKDGYCGYPVGFMNGAIVGQGQSYSEALTSTEESITAFIEYYGSEKFYEHFADDINFENVYVAEAVIV